MTLGEMKRDIAADLMETPDTPGGGDPFGIARLLVRAANETAQASDCLFGSRTTGLIANQADYCVSDVYRIKAVAITSDTGGIYSPVQIADIRDADGLLGSNWQNAKAGANPDYAIFYGANRIVLNAPPSTTRAGGLTFYGFCKPGEIWAYTSLGVPIPLDDTHECPLPVWAHACVQGYAHYLRASATVNRNRPEVVAQIPELKNRYDELLASVRRDAALHHARTG